MVVGSCPGMDYSCQLVDLLCGGWVVERNPIMGEEGSDEKTEREIFSIKVIRF